MYEDDWVSTGDAPGWTQVPQQEAEVRSLETTEDAAKKMLRDLIPHEFGSLLAHQLDGRANRVHTGEFPALTNPVKTTTIGDEGELSKKSKRAIAKGASTKWSKTRRATKASNPSSAGSEVHDESSTSEDEGDDETNGASTLVIAAAPSLEA
uniref:Uncharacterized protein n=1 Tax=Oryza punctata TaxID=4537 RepID=A0A0E0KFQ0_ORYPU